MINRWIKIKCHNSTYFVYCNTIDKDGINGYFSIVARDGKIIHSPGNSIGFFHWKDILELKVV